MKEIIVKMESDGQLFPVRELIRCKDCEFSYTEGFVHERLCCEKHPELEEIKDDWFCGDAKPEEGDQA